MTGTWRARLRRWFVTAATLALLGAAFALLVAWLGIVNIGASVGHPEAVERFLELGLRRSVRRHSRELVPPVDIASMDRVRLGAAHFAGSCAECHGEPGNPRNPVYDHMLPVPPDLAALAPTWSTREQFFIVRHGLQFTGMPAWSGGDRADEVWSVVAFLQQLPALGVDDYRALAAGNRTPLRERPAEVVRVDGVEQLARAACDRCHDTANAAPPSVLIPRLAGQPAAFIARSLREYQRGERHSGFMQPVAAQLTERDIDALAAHYSAMPLAPAAAVVTELSTVQQTEAAAIANGAHPDVRLPACLSCHGSDARTDYPRLSGQQAAYLAQQLRLFQNGGRQTSAWGEVMTVIAERLDDAQVDLLAEWFAQQPPINADD